MTNQMAFCYLILLKLLAIQRGPSNTTYSITLLQDILTTSVLNKLVMRQRPLKWKWHRISLPRSNFGGQTKIFSLVLMRTSPTYTAMLRVLFSKAGLCHHLDGMKTLYSGFPGQQEQLSETSTACWWSIFDHGTSSMERLMSQRTEISQ